jgi:Tfp pilus assembly protein FimT
MKQNGYTLRGLAVCLSIIAIISSTVWFGVSNSPNTQINRAAILIANDIRYAQQLSIQTGIPHRVVISPIGNTYTIQRYNHITLDIYRWTDLSDQTTNIPLYNASFHLVTTASTIPIIGFTARGTISTGASTIVITNNIYNIQLTTTVGGGRVYIGNSIRIS